MAKNNIEKFRQEVQKLMKKYGVDMGFKFVFPGRQRPPRLAKFAFWLLNRTKFTLSIQIEETEVEKNK